MDNMSQQAFLFFEEGALAGQKHAVDRPSVIIGRGGANTRCDIVLPERQVSRQHAEIYFERGRYFLKDLGSKNGTYLNGQPVDEAIELYDNDTIQIALCERVRFIGADATLPLDEVEPMRGIRLDPQSRRVWIGSIEIVPPLSPAQYRLLELLHEQVGQVRSRDEIVSAVWAEADKDGVTEQAIDALIRRLRDRLSEVDPDGQYVITVRGHGFRLDPSGGRR
jgi:pSer/pThr/pTyr-binding forkhead associated (FHA) protein